MFRLKYKCVEQSLACSGVTCVKHRMCAVLIGSQASAHPGLWLSFCFPSRFGPPFSMCLGMWSPSAYAHVLLVPSLTRSTLRPCGSLERPAPCLFHQSICYNSDTQSASYPVYPLVPPHGNIWNARFPLWNLLSKTRRSLSHCVQCSNEVQSRSPYVIPHPLRNKFRSKNKAKFSTVRFLEALQLKMTFQHPHMVS